MKPKLLLGVSALTLLLLVWLAKVAPKAEGPAVVHGGEEPSKELSTGAAANPNTVSSPSVNSEGPVTEHGLEGNGATQVTRDAPNQPNTDTRCAELMDLSMNNDSASLAAILGELRNPDPAIRAAAVVAAIQFGSRDAIPSLVDAAQETTDGNERTNILEAIEFLKLPSLSEVMAQRPSPPAAQPSN